jgi:hypothetical protein
MGRKKPCLRGKEWKKIYQVNGLWKQAGVAILILDKVDFKRELVRKDKEGHFILIKEAIQKEEVWITNLYVSSISVFNFIKCTIVDLKTQIDPNTMVVRDFNTSLSWIDRLSRQNSKRNPRIEWYHRLIELIDVYRVFCLATTQYTFCSAAQQHQNRPNFRSENRSQQI